MTNPMNEPDEVLTASEVAHVLKCSKSQIYRLRFDGKLLPRYKLFEGQKGWRWTRADVDAYLNRCSSEPRERFDQAPPFLPVRPSETISSERRGSSCFPVSGICVLECW
jgi:excisionase family DNA binding protein